MTEKTVMESKFPNMTCVEYAEKLREQQFTFEIALSVVSSWNTYKNNPPMTEKEIYDLVKTAYAKTQVKPFVNKELILELINDNKQYWYDKRFFPCALANRITYIYPKQNSDKTKNRGFLVLNDNNNTILYYKDGVYSFNATNYISGIVHDVLGNDFSKTRLSEVLSCIKSDANLKITMDDMKVDSRYICFKNGVYDRTDKKLLDFSPEFRFINQINATYNPDAKCPNIEKFISEIVGNDDIVTLYEIIALIFLRDYKYQHIFYLTGNGCNGKTVYCNLLDIFLGFENVSHENIKDLTENVFSLSSLRYKLANIGDDIGYTVIPVEASSVLKRISGRLARLSSQAKHEKSVDSPFYSTLVFNNNELPVFEDTTDGMSRRNFAILFPNQFVGKHDDKDLLQKLITDDEKSGLVNIVLKTLDELETRGNFSNAISIDEMKKTYEIFAQPEKSFIRKNYEYTKDKYAFLDTSDVYSEYIKFCVTRQISKPLSNRQFLKSFQVEIKGSTIGQQAYSIDSDRPYVLKNVKRKQQSGQETLGGI